VKFLVVQLSVDDIEPSPKRIRRVINLLANLNSEVFVVLPELWVSGAFSKNAYARLALEENANFLREFNEKEITSQGVLGTFLTRNTDNKISNRLIYVSKNSNQYYYDKIHTFGVESEESKLVESGSSYLVDLESKYKFGFCVCYDIRFPELMRKMTYNGMEVLIVSASWPESRIDHWKKLLLARAIENQIYVIAVNAVGMQGGTKLGGNSLFISPQGEVLGELSNHEEFVEFQLDSDTVRNTRDVFPVLRDIRILSID
jgi:predicted amidohydrolase